jgi:hypothetical protein
VQLDGFPDEPQHFLTSLADRDTAGKSGTWAPQLASPRSMTTMYRIIAITSPSSGQPLSVWHSDPHFHFER